MRPSIAEVAADLEVGQAALRQVLTDLPPDGWERSTPAPGWTVRHQVRHLAQGEELGGLAATDTDAFGKELVRMLGDLEAIEAATTAGPAEPVDELVERWSRAAAGLRAAVLSGPAEERIAWVTGPMGRASFLTARVMETFAHGHDIGTAVGVTVPCEEALPHIAWLGVSTRRFAYANRGLPLPEAEVRVELTGPQGELWAFGPEGAADLVRGPALDFCLLVTQRVHRDDTALEATGPTAEGWLAIAQCFAGPPTDGPPRSDP